MNAAVRSVDDSDWDTLLVLDTIEDRLVSQSLELIPFEDILAANDPSRTMLLIPGKDVAALAGNLAGQFGLPVIVCEHDQLYYPNPELLGQLLQETVAEFRPRTICFLHTMRNCQTAAALSVYLGYASVTAVTSWSPSADGPLFGRAIVNGKLLQTVLPTTPGTIITILPGTFSLTEPVQAQTPQPATLMRRRYPSGETSCLPMAITSEPENGARLEDAEVVIAAGRGLGKQEHLGLLEEVARMFANAAIGASRPLCDQKWLPFSRQVGVTGKTVSPRLYLACGISGAQQHLAGVKGSRFIVAINRDPDAAIFSVADCIVIGDLHTFLPLLVRKYRERRTINDHQEQCT